LIGKLERINAELSKMTHPINRTLFQYIPESSATAASQGLITLKNLQEGTYYLGLENYNTISGAQVNIEAVAIQSFVVHPASNRN